MKRRQRRSDCPIHFALEVFGDAWSLLIVRDLMFTGRKTYTDFLRAEEGVATNILADRLVRLVEDGIVEKLDTGDYCLTPMGVDLLPVMLEIIAWTAKHDPKTAAEPADEGRLRTDKARLTRELHRCREVTLHAGKGPSRGNRTQNRKKETSS